MCLAGCLLSILVYVCGLVRCNAANVLAPGCTTNTMHRAAHIVVHVQEFLAEACSGNEPMLQGRRHFAEQALARVSSLRCAERLRQLLARPGPEERLDEGALLLVRLQCLAGGKCFEKT